MRPFLIAVLLASPAWARIPTERQFDVGPKDAPVSKGFTAVFPDDLYTVDRGYGFYKSKPKALFDDAKHLATDLLTTYDDDARPFDPDALRDGAEADGPLSFRANLYPGEYIVTVAMGRPAHPRAWRRSRCSGISPPS